ncbi:hypothetical protein MRB53_042282 [Persea americana]|nr:hypothetical protein MRB53_042282 [Persea americana]
MHLRSESRQRVAGKRGFVGRVIVNGLLGDNQIGCWGHGLGHGLIRSCAVVGVWNRNQGLVSRFNIGVRCQSPMSGSDVKLRCQGPVHVHGGGCWKTGMWSGRKLTRGNLREDRECGRNSIDGDDICKF